MSSNMGSPPLARGTATIPRYTSVCAGITPACAGNSLSPCGGWQKKGDHPRLRGEQGRAAGGRHLIQGSPPLARGTVRKSGRLSRLSGITPACAGNSHKRTGLYKRRGDHPRLRGEQPTDWRCGGNGEGSPPLARGTGLRSNGASSCDGITPACAGNRAKVTSFSAASADHPRLRGEQGWRGRRRSKVRGSPPLARGTGKYYGTNGTRMRITPACAGNRAHIDAGIGRDEDHPRLRGEQFKTAALSGSPLGSPPLARGTVSPPCSRICFTSGSPPLARGTAISRRFGKMFCGITPACAGNSAPCDLLPPRHRDHPRLRGEQHKIPPDAARLLGSPPLARGTDCLAVEGGGGNGITPACAGNSPFCLSACRVNRDHPRLRGEQTNSYKYLGVCMGSPPLARGTATSDGNVFIDCGITPACAGNSESAPTSPVDA